VCLNLITNDKCKTIGDKLDAFRDKSRHTALFENFIGSTYHNITLSELLLIMNVKNQNTNVLSLIEGQAKKSWLCK